MLLHFTVAAFTTRRLLQRECPVCGHVQTVPPSKIRVPVTCERCELQHPAETGCSCLISTSGGRSSCAPLRRR